MVNQGPPTIAVFNSLMPGDTYTLLNYVVIGIGNSLVHKRHQAIT